MSGGRGARGELRSAADSLLMHDLKNVEHRLGLLLSNLEANYGDPDFKRSVAELLRSTVERIDAGLARWAASRDAVVIKVPIDLGDLLRRSLGALRPRAQAPGVRVSLEAGSVPRVWGDSLYLAEAFQAIAENALEAAATEVRVRAFAGRAGARPSVVVEVADDGAGMPAGFVARELFQAFRTTKPDGVGLGLFSARQVVRLHGGRIEVESREGEGTTVRVTLPAVAARKARPSKGA